MVTDRTDRIAGYAPRLFIHRRHQQCLTLLRGLILVADPIYHLRALLLERGFHFLDLRLHLLRFRVIRREQGLKLRALAP